MGCAGKRERGGAAWRSAKREMRGGRAEDAIARPRESARQSVARWHRCQSALMQPPDDEDLVMYVCVCVCGCLPYGPAQGFGSYRVEHGVGLCARRHPTHLHTEAKSSGFAAERLRRSPDTQKKNERDSYASTAFFFASCCRCPRACLCRCHFRQEVRSAEGRRWHVNSAAVASRGHALNPRFLVTAPVLVVCVIEPTHVDERLLA